MKAKFKMPRKDFIRLIQYVGKLDCCTYFTNITNIDKINLREMYIDAMLTHEKFKTDKEYQKGVKENPLTININYFRTLEKISDFLWLKNISNYETNLIRIISRQVTPQINFKVTSNEQLN